MTTAGAGRRKATAILIGGAGLIAAVALSLAFGSRDVGFGEIAAGLTAFVTGTESTDIAAVAVEARIPRTVLALLGGAALAMSGALMQAITRNPLADPGILGVNSGAALFVVIGIVFIGISSPWHFMIAAVLGSALAATFVYLVGSAGVGGATPIKLALAGAATAAALSSLISALLLPNPYAMDLFRFWQIGGVGGASWDEIGVAAPLIAAATVGAFLLTGPLNAIALGDDVATGLGVNITRTRLLAAVAGVALCGITTAVAGPIAFVGLMIPHAVRMLTGPDQRWIMPLSALWGAVLLVLADTIGRLIGRPGEVEAGIITAILGAPVLIAIARRARMRAL